MQDQPAPVLSVAVDGADWEGCVRSAAAFSLGIRGKFFHLSVVRHRNRLLGEVVEAPVQVRCGLKEAGLIEGVLPVAGAWN